MAIVVRRLNSISELREAASAWDDLWLRSDIVVPTARAELIALWCESFAADCRFSALVVEQDGQLVAALPWIERRKYGLKTAALPGGVWSSAGDLLLDPDCDHEQTLAWLLVSLRGESSRLLWVDAAPTPTPRWQAFSAHLEKMNTATVRSPRFRVNRVEIGSDWQSYLAHRSRNHRHYFRNALARANQSGQLVLEHHCELSGDAWQSLLRACFEVEASGWKGRSASAVLNGGQTWDFYARQARQLADWGQLRLTLLRLDSRVIASEYGWCAKGVYCSPKVGYDENFSRLSPGQLLRGLLIEELHRDGNVQVFDFFGPSSTATSKWATSDYAVDRIAVSLGDPLSRSLLTAYRYLRPLARRVLSRHEADAGESAAHCDSATPSAELPVA